jgi:hypothetical protein
MGCDSARLFYKLVFKVAFFQAECRKTDIGMILHAGAKSLSHPRRIYWFPPDRRKLTTRCHVLTATSRATLIIKFEKS